jgi:hypothetical protein
MEDIKKNPMYKYLLILVICATAGLQGWMALYTNFAKEVIGVNGFEMGMAQSIREIPGFLTFLVLYILIVFREYRLSAWSVVVMGIGVGCTGFFHGYGGLLLATFIMSVGFHYFETTNKSLTIQHFDQSQAPVVFARLRGYGALANIVVGGLIWGLSFVFSYEINFLILGIFITCTGVFMLFRHPVKEDKKYQKPQLSFQRKYWLFYLLNFLSGARRQIFTVFAIFLLVEKYKLSVSVIAGVYVVNYIMNYFTNPLISKAINKYGEKVVLSLENASLVVLFLGYAFIENVYIVLLLYVIDNIFFNFSIGLNTYLQKIADKKDFSSLTAVGFTINHISAVIIPLFGGALWLLNWKLPFLIGACLTLVSLYYTQKIKIASRMEAS